MSVSNCLKGEIFASASVRSFNLSSSLADNLAKFANSFSCTPTYEIHTAAVHIITRVLYIKYFIKMLNVLLFCTHCKN